MNTFCYGIKQGFKNIWHNRLFSLAAVGTIAACLFLFGIFYALVSNFQNIVRNVESNVGLTVFFEEDITEKKIQAIGTKIKGYQEVEKVEYISAEEAWENFKEEMYQGDEELAETFGGDNPLEDSASYEVYLKEVSAQKEVIARIEKLDGVRTVNSSDTVATGLGRFHRLAAYVSVTMIVLLLFVSVFLISTAVATGIRVRQAEISIMKYIGATDLFVRLPFVFEGLLVGLAGAVIPLVILWGVYEKVITFILKHFSVLSAWLTFVPVKEEFMVLIPVSLCVGVGIGFVGSSLSVRRNLRKVNNS